MSAFKLHIIDIGIIAVYLAVCLFAGLRGWKNVKTVKDYCFGGKPFHTTALVVTTIATVISGGLTLGFIELSFALGIIFVVPILLTPLSWFITSRLLSRNFDLFKKKKFSTMSEIMEHWYGKCGLWFTNIYLVIDIILFTSAGITALGYLFHYFLGISEWQGAFIGLAVIVFYSAMGGIRADITTDIFQFIVFLIVLPIVFKGGLDKVGSLEKVFTSLPKSHLSVNSSNIIFFVCLMVYSFLPNIDIPYIQRTLIAKNKLQVIRTFNITAVFLIPFILMIVLMGLIIYTIYPNVQPKAALYHFISNSFSSGFIGLLIVSVLAMAMSTLDSYLSAVSTVVAKNIFKRIYPNLSDSQQLVIIRLSCVLISLIALFLAYVKFSMLDLIMIMNNFWFPVVGIPFIAGLLGFRCSGRVFVLIVAGSIFTTIVIRIFSGEFGIVNTVICIAIVAVFIYFIDKIDKIRNSESRDVCMKDKICNLLILKLRSSLINVSCDCKLVYIFGFTLLSSYVVSILFLPVTNDFIMYLRIAVILVCLGLVFHDFWNVEGKKSLTFPIWCSGLCFCLPFASSYQMFASGYDYLWIINHVISLVFLYTLVDVVSFIILTFVGFTFSYAVFLIMGKPIIGYLCVNNTFALVSSAFTILAITLYMCIKSFVRKETLLLMEGKVVETKEELQHALSIKKEFLGKFNHEIRTSLQGIIGISTEVSQGWDRYLPEERKRFVDMVASDGKRLSTYAQNILDLVDYKTGELKLDVQRMDIVELIKEAILSVEAEITLEAKDLRIEFEKDLLRDAEIDCDRNKVLQLFSRLLGNAVKYSDGGKILITVKDVEQVVQVSIIDEGIGIPEEEKIAIFEPFTEGSRTKNDAKGTGLGLSICSEIVFLHKGRIWVENNKYRGARFVFTLPYRQKLDYESLLTLKIKRKRKILVIDDEESSLTAMDLILTSLKHTPITINSGITAIEYLENNYSSVDIILLDLMMPDMTGVEFLKKLRDDRRFKNIPVIIQSGFVNSPDILAAMNMGAERRTIAKPYMKQEVEEVIDCMYEQIEKNKKVDDKAEEEDDEYEMLVS